MRSRLVHWRESRGAGAPLASSVLHPELELHGVDWLSLVTAIGLYDVTTREARLFLVDWNVGFTQHVGVYRPAA